jgi:hypothetical protein
MLSLVMRVDAPALPQICVSCAGQILAEAEREHFTGEAMHTCEHRHVAAVLAFQEGKVKRWSFGHESTALKRSSDAKLH